MFKTDGSVHHGGVKNEEITVQILNNLKLYPCVVETRGGTKVKEDAIAGGKKISIKKKEGLKQGSFDWFNTSKYNEVLGGTFDSFVTSMSNMRQLPADIRSDECFIEMVRYSFNELCEAALESLTSDNIKQILQKGLVGDNEDLDVVINDVKANQLFVFPAANHPAFQLLAQGYTPVLKGSGKSSRQIFFTKDGETYNTGIRLRVTSNNGINAFLGLSKANKNSQVVIKLQQDGIPSLVLKAQAQVYDY